MFDKLVRHLSGLEGGIRCRAVNASGDALFLIGNDYRLRAATFRRFSHDEDARERQMHPAR